MATKQKTEKAPSARSLKKTASAPKAAGTGRKTVGERIQEAVAFIETRHREQPWTEQELQEWLEPQRFSGRSLKQIDTQLKELGMEFANAEEPAAKPAPKQGRSRKKAAEAETDKPVKKTRTRKAKSGSKQEQATEKPAPKKRRTRRAKRAKAEEAAEQTPESVLAELVERGKRSGSLTYEEVMDAFESFDLSPEKVEELYVCFNREHIDILTETKDDLDEDSEKEDELSTEAEDIRAANLFAASQDTSDAVHLDDPVRMYLKEIGRVPLLKADEEVALAKRIERGKEVENKHRHFRDLKTFVIKLSLSVHEDMILPYEALTKIRANLLVTDEDFAFVEHGLASLGIQIQGDLSLREAIKMAEKYKDMPPAEREGKKVFERKQVKEILDTIIENPDVSRDQDVLADAHEAKQALTDANLRLVVSIAKRYVGRGMQFLDLMQEGNLGLIKAVEKFDYKKGYKFSTYATWWIRQAITRAIADQARTIRIPVHMVETINKLSRTSRNLLQELGRDPTPEEIAEKMEITVERVREIMKISQEPVSLETPIGEEEDSHLVEFIEDRNAVAPEEAASAILLREQVDDILQGLTTRERDVIYLRFGLKDGKQRTLEEVGQYFDVTRERIRQIERKALEKLRSKGKREKITDYL